MSGEYREFQSIRIEGVVLGISQEYGAIVVYTKKDLRGKSVEIFLREGYKNRMNANIVERIVNGQSMFAAVFPRVKPDNYIVDGPKRDQFEYVTVFPGSVAEVDWR